MEFGEFTEAYFVLLTRAWISEEYVAELLADPSPALREAGFEVPPGIDVEVIRHSDGEADLEWQYQMWLEGIAAGSARLYLPEPEPVHFRETLGDRVGGHARWGHPLLLVLHLHCSVKMHSSHEGWM